MGFEPMRGISPPNRLAGGRTRPLCDPSDKRRQYTRDLLISQLKKYRGWLTTYSLRLFDGGITMINQF